MQARKIFSISGRAIFCILTFLVSSAAHASSLPYPGQNIWHVVAQTGTQVEELLTCCANTFTALATLQSDIDVSFAGTFTAIAGLQSDLDICCTTLNSKVDSLTTIVNNDFTGTFTWFNALNSDFESLVSYFDSLITITVNADFFGTYTILNALQSDLDQCCFTLNSKVDYLQSDVDASFAHTFTAIAAIPAANFTGTYTAIAGLQSDLDQCCSTLNSKVDYLQSDVDASFAHTFTAIAAIPAADFTGTYTTLSALRSDLDACCSSIESTLSTFSVHVNVDFTETFTAIAGLQSDLDQCCFTLNSKVDYLQSDVDVSFVGTFTAIAAIPAADFTGTYTTLSALRSDLDACCSSIESTLSTFSVHVNVDFTETFTAIAGLQSDLDQCCSTLNSKVDYLQSDVDASFAHTFTAIAGIPAANFTGTYTAIAALESDLDQCCFTLNSKVDSLTTIINNDFAGTFTAIAAIHCSSSSTGTSSCDLSGTYTWFNALQSNLDQCCSTLNSKVDYLQSDIDVSFVGTFTAIAAIPAADFTGTYTTLSALRSDLDACCSSIESTLSTFSVHVNVDFTETFTAIAGLQSDLDQCCSTLNSKVDYLQSDVDVSFVGTFTAIAAIPAADFTGTYTTLSALRSDLDACCSSIESTLSTFSVHVNVDFTETFTAIAGLQSDLDQCCFTLNSKVDYLQSDVDVSFVGTFTAIGALGLCDATPITSITTISMPGIYCLAHAISAPGPLITISSSNVVLDLNGYLLNATANAAIAINNTTGLSNIIIKNGFLDGIPAGTNGIATTGSLLVQDLQLLNLNILAFGSDGITISHAQQLKIENCMVSFADNGITFTTCSNATANNNSFNNNTNNGAMDLSTLGCTNVLFANCIFNNNGVDGVNFSVSTCIELLACQANANSANGFQFSDIADDITLEQCLACLNTGTGYAISIGLSNSAALIECIAQDNSQHGFDFEFSSGNGTIQSCKAIDNGACGFNDSLSSSYQYISNFGQGNGLTPANPAGDSNYCDSSMTTTLASGTPPVGFAPFYQNARNSNGTFAGISNWDNITLQ